MADLQELDVIWLQPWCRDCQLHGDDRTWSADDVWVQCDECERKPVKYIRVVVESLGKSK